MDLKYHGDKLDQTGLKDQTELNSHGDKLELSVVFIYEQFSIISINSVLFVQSDLLDIIYLQDNIVLFGPLHMLDLIYLRDKLDLTAKRTKLI